MATQIIWARATDGDDDNDGTADDAAHAVRTLQGARDLIPDDPEDDYEIRLSTPGDYALAGAPVIWDVPNAEDVQFLVRGYGSGAVRQATRAECESKAHLVAASESPTFLLGVITASATGLTVADLGLFNSSATALPGHPAIRNDVSATFSNVGAFHGPGGSYNSIWAVHSKGGNLLLLNCFGASGDLGVVAEGGTVEAYHTSIVTYAGARAAFLAFTTAVVTNGCAAQGPAAEGAWWNLTGVGGNVSGDHNVGPDETAPGANSVPDAEGLFEDETVGDEDFALTEPVPIVDRTGYPDETDTDVVGTARPGDGADPGCWQTPSGGGGGAAAALLIRQQIERRRR